jgi:hypothetical protein
MVTLVVPLQFPQMAVDMAKFPMEKFPMAPDKVKFPPFIGKV